MYQVLLQKQNVMLLRGITVSELFFSHKSAHDLPKSFAASFGIRNDIFDSVVIVIFCTFLHVVNFITLRFVSMKVRDRMCLKCLFT